MVGLWKEVGLHLLKSTLSVNSHKQILNFTSPIRFQAESTGKQQHHLLFSNSQSSLPPEQRTTFS